jgi:hypothetical protein
LLALFVGDAAPARAKTAPRRGASADHAAHRDTGVRASSCEVDQIAR